MRIISRGGGCCVEGIKTSRGVRGGQGPSERESSWCRVVCVGWWASDQRTIRWEGGGQKGGRGQEGLLSCVSGGGRGADGEGGRKRERERERERSGAKIEEGRARDRRRAGVGVGKKTGACRRRQQVAAADVTGGGGEEGQVTAPFHKAAGAEGQKRSRESGRRRGKEPRQAGWGGGTQERLRKNRQ